MSIPTVEEQVARATRLVLITDEAMRHLAEAVGCTVDWGEPDEDGIYTPTLTKYSTTAREFLASQVEPA